MSDDVRQANCAVVPWGGLRFKVLCCAGPSDAGTASIAAAAIAHGPQVRYRRHGMAHEIECDYIAAVTAFTASAGGVCR